MKKKEVITQQELLCLQPETEFVKNRCEDKLALVSEYYNLEAYRGIELNIHSFYTLRLHGEQWSVSSCKDR